MSLSQTIEYPTAPVFEPLLDRDVRYLGAHGGRASGKSHFFADRLVEDCLEFRGTAAACIREVQRTLSQSSKRLVESKLRQYGFGEPQGFKIFKDVIETPGDGIISFIGMQDHTADSIKSLEDYRIFWWDEAQNASAYSLKILRPTMRHANGQLWFSWNPKDTPDADHPDASVDGLFRLSEPMSLPGKGICVQANYNRNPWLPQGSRDERMYDKAHRIAEDYAHIWEGAYLTRSESRVFHNWKVVDFETPAGCIYRFGADFGFSVDPTVLVRCWVGDLLSDGAAVHNINGRHLFIDYEAYRVGCDVDYTPALFGGASVAGAQNPYGNRNPFNDDGIPDAMRWPITADSARPETISYCQRHGFPNMRSAIKGANSVEEGVEFLKAFTIVIHPRCRHTADEFLCYSWKTDPKTEKILPILQDKKNHVIDSCRYAVEDIRRGKGWFG